MRLGAERAENQDRYCKDEDRTGRSEHEKLDFLGYAFQARRARNWEGKYFVSFLPAISDKASRAIREEMRSWKLQTRSDKSLEDLSRMFNPIVRGWVQYYGRYYRSLLYPVFKQLDRSLSKWASRNTGNSRAIGDGRHIGSPASRGVNSNCLPTGRSA